MKKHISLILVLLLLCSITPVFSISVYNDTKTEYTIGEITLTFSKDSGTIYEIKACPDRLILPAEIDGVPIKSIYSQALASVQHITDIYLPAGFTDNDFYFIHNSPNLKSITVDKDNPYLMDIDGIVYNKSGTALLSYPANKPGNSYSIPAQVTQAGSYAFINNQNLQTLTIPARLCSIAFLTNFKSLEAIYVDSDNPCLYAIDGVLFRRETGSLEDKRVLLLYPPKKADATYRIPDNVIAITLFTYNANIEALHFPKTLQFIDSASFYGLKSLKSITIDEENEYFVVKDDVLFKKGKNELLLYLNKRQGTSYCIPGSTQRIASHAFYDCETLETLFIPEGINELEDTAFGRNCGNLKNLYLPKSLYGISLGVFRNCSPDLTVYGYTGSVAEKYAEMANVNFALSPYLYFDAEASIGVDKVSLDLSAINAPDTGTLVTAIYNRRNKLLGVRLTPIEELYNQTSIDISCTQSQSAYCVKMFLLEDLECTQTSIIGGCQTLWLL